VAVGIFEVVESHAQLPQIVLARRSPGGLAGGLYGRQEQAHERADNRSHNQELNESESVSGARERGRERFAEEAEVWLFHREITVLWTRVKGRNDTETHSHLDQRERL
jgi:hypothetical protein